MTHPILREAAGVPEREDHVGHGVDGGEKRADETRSNCELEVRAGPRVPDLVRELARRALEIRRHHDGTVLVRFRGFASYLRIADRLQ